MKNTEKEKTTNKEKKDNPSRRSSTTSSETKTNQPTSSSEKEKEKEKETVSRSKSTTDQSKGQSNSDFHSGAPGTTTGGYGDQHNEERLKEPKEENKGNRNMTAPDRNEASTSRAETERDFSDIRSERTERYGFEDRGRNPERDSGYHDYDRGFRDGSEHASRHYNQQNWERQRNELRNRGSRPNYDYNARSRNRDSERYESGWGRRDYERNENRPYDNYGDVDTRSSRSYPSEQAGYENRDRSRDVWNDRNFNRPETRETGNDPERDRSRDVWNEYDRDRDRAREMWNEGDRNRPAETWNEYDRNRGSNRPYGEDYRGEQRGYRGNEYGNPYDRDRNESGGRSDSFDRNSDRGGEYRREGDSNFNRDREPGFGRERNRYEQSRGLRNTRAERERGDRDREW